MENGELNLISLSQHFSDEDKAREFLEGLRWPDGPVCPKCGEINNAYRLEPKPSKKGKHVRKGVWKCAGCREQFTVTVGTIFEDSHIPLDKWLLAYYLLCSSKKGVSAHQLHRMLKLNYRSAWFMAHRIRYTMSQEPLSSKLGGIIEIDEVYIGGKRRHRFPQAVKPGQRQMDRPGPFVDKAPVVSVLPRRSIYQIYRLDGLKQRWPVPAFHPKTFLCNFGRKVGFSPINCEASKELITCFCEARSTVAA